MVIVKECKKHGSLKENECNIELSDGYKCYRCVYCKREKDARWKNNNREQHNAASVKWKKENREHYNQWLREDRKKDPEKYRQYERNSVNKYGITKIRRTEVLRIHGLTIEQHDKMIKLHENRCAICKKEETRKGRSGSITPLCIDHCHLSNKIRGLLCHDCNTGIGKFKDSIDFLVNAIEYLKRNLI
jgi:hypothetical protein